MHKVASIVAITVLSLSSAQGTLVPGSLYIVGRHANFEVSSFFISTIDSSTGGVIQSINSFSASNQIALPKNGIAAINNNIYIGWEGIVFPGTNPSGIGSVNLQNGMINNVIDNFNLQGGLTTDGINLLVGGANTLLTYDPTTGQLISTLSPIDPNPAGPIVDIAWSAQSPSNNLLWSDVNGVIKPYDIVTNMAFVDGLDYDAGTGLIWVSGRTNSSPNLSFARVQAYTLSGQLVRQFDYPDISIIGDLVYIPIPAPAASGLFLAGALLATRRRR